MGVNTGGFENTTICCSFSVRDGHELAAPDLRVAVARLVPRYMVPARWERPETLPQNVNGKIDRPALRERFAPQKPTATPAAGGR